MTHKMLISRECVRMINGYKYFMVNALGGATVTVILSALGSVLGTSTGFTSDVIKQISEAVRYSQEHNNTQ